MGPGMREELREIFPCHWEKGQNKDGKRIRRLIVSCSCSFFYPANIIEHLLCARHVRSIRDTAVNKTGKNPCLHRTDIFIGDNKPAKK